MTSVSSIDINWICLLCPLFCWYSFLPVIPFFLLSFFFSLFSISCLPLPLPLPGLLDCLLVSILYLLACSLAGRNACPPACLLVDMTLTLVCSLTLFMLRRERDPAVVAQRAVGVGIQLWTWALVYSYYQNPQDSCRTYLAHFGTFMSWTFPKWHVNKVTRKLDGGHPSSSG